MPDANTAKRRGARERKKKEVGHYPTNPAKQQKVSFSTSKKTGRAEEEKEEDKVDEEDDDEEENDEEENDDEELEKCGICQENKAVRIVNFDNENPLLVELIENKGYEAPSHGTPLAFCASCYSEMSTTCGFSLSGSEEDCHFGSDNEEEEEDLLERELATLKSHLLPCNVVLPDTTERDCHVTFYPDFAGAQGVTPFEYFLRKLSEATDSAAIPENVQYFYRIAKTSAWCSIHLPKAWNMLVEVFLQKNGSRDTVPLGNMTWTHRRHQG